VAKIPMAALVAVMIMVSIGTFNWDSVRKLREHPPSSSIVMIATVTVTVATHDLAKGVFVGVLLSGIFFANKVGHLMRVDSRAEDGGDTRVYTVTGQVFFASAEAFVDAFDFREVVKRVRIDVSPAHFWDLTAVGALDKVVLKFRREGALVEVLGHSGAEARELARELAMQVAAVRPAYVNRTQVPAELLEKEKDIYREELRTAKRPEAMWDKILTGKLEKFYEQNCLVDQPWIKEDKKKVHQLIGELGKKAGATLTVGRVARLEVGEGIEKKKDDLAAEVAKTLAQP